MLNSPEQLEAVKDANNLAAIIAALNAEQEAEKKRKLDEKKLAAAEKMTKRAIEAANLAEERARRLPSLQNIVRKGLVHAKGLKNGEMKEILVYYFHPGSTGLSSMAKPKLQAELARRWSEVVESDKPTDLELPKEEAGGEEAPSGTI